MFTLAHTRVENKHGKLKRVGIASLVQVIALGLVLFVLLPQFNTFKESFTNLASVTLYWLIIIFALTALTYLTAAFTLKTFSIYPMAQRDSTMVQLAASFTNRLLPSGVGGIALNIQFLRTRGHKVAEATSVLLMQRTMDFVGFMAPLFFIIVLSQNELANLVGFDINVTIILAVILVVVALIAILASIKKIRVRVVEFVTKMMKTLLKLATNPIVLGKGFLSSTLMNLAFLSALFFSLRAVGLDISFVESTLVFAGAAAASSVAPTPGGIGIVEAAMVTALIALGYSGDIALAGVLLYRLFTYWLPIPFGWLSYRYIINQKLI